MSSSISGVSGVTSSVFNVKAIMQRAHKLSKSASLAHGGKPSEFFTACLKASWGIAKAEIKLSLRLRKTAGKRAQSLKTVKQLKQTANQKQEQVFMILLGLLCFLSFIGLASKGGLNVEGITTYTTHATLNTTQITFFDKVELFYQIMLAIVQGVL